MAQIKCELFNFSTGNCTHVDITKDFSKTLTITDSAGAAIDLTPDTFQMTIKDALDGNILFTLVEVVTNLLTGLYIPAPTSGVIDIQITDTDTAITPGVYPYELQKTDTDGKIFVFMQGTMQFYDRGF